MKVVVAAFNQEKALVGAFYVITNLRICFGWNLKAMFQGSPKDKSPTVTKGNIRSRRASSSEGSRRGSMVQKRSG